MDLRHNEVNLYGIKIPLFIGILDWEKQHVQTVELDLSIRIENLMVEQEPVVDYDDLTQSLCQAFAQQKIELIESLAEQVAQFIKQRYAVLSVQVRVKKAVVIAGSPNTVEVCIRR